MSKRVVGISVNRCAEFVECAIGIALRPQGAPFEVELMRSRIDVADGSGIIEAALGDRPQYLGGDEPRDLVLNRENVSDQR